MRLTAPRLTRPPTRRYGVALALAAAPQPPQADRNSVRQVACRRPPATFCSAGSAGGLGRDGLGLSASLSDCEQLGESNIALLTYSLR